MLNDEIYRDMLVDSDLIAYSFELRSETFDADAAATLVGWLAEEFTLRRCDWLASAISTVKGREHHVAFRYADGRLAHAIAAASPQYGTDLRGGGCDILGRRPLAKMEDEIRGLVSDVFVETGRPMPTDAFDDGELDALVDLAAALPWTAHLVGRPAPEPDGQHINAIAGRLGMNPASNA